MHASKKELFQRVFLLFCVVVAICVLYYAGLVFIYAFQHHSINGAIPSIKYSKLSKSANQALHIDSYTVNNKKQIYYDSLLERYAYFDTGNYHFVNSYVGSHGIVSFKDPIMSVSLAPNEEYADGVAVSHGLKYSNLQMSRPKVIDYANQTRITGSKWLYRGVNIFNRHSRIFGKKKVYLDLRFHRYGSQDLFDEDDYDFTNVVITDVLSTPNYAPNEIYAYKSRDCVHIAKDYSNLFEKHGMLPVAQRRRLLPHWTYNNGKKIKVYAFPKDKTRYFLGDKLQPFEFYNELNTNVLYSNGNTYFLQYMYDDLLNMRTNSADYNVIDVYHKGWHLNPIMFNDFVYQPYQYSNNDLRPNNYKSPYLFNYKIKGKRVWNQIEPVSKQMINFVERQNYNLPCNYNDKHYYYRTIEGTIIPDSNIKYVNGNVKPLIMGDIHDKKVMPDNKKDQAYYATKMEYDFAKKYRNNYKNASQYLNYERSDGGLEPLWMIGLTKDKEIGTYHPGEIVRYNDKLSTKPISKYYIVQHSKHYYLPTYNVHGVTCFKATVVFKNKIRYFVRAQDAYMLMGNKIHHQ